MLRRHCTVSLMLIVGKVVILKDALGVNYVFVEGGRRGMEEYVFKVINFNLLFLCNFPFRLVQHYPSLQAQ